jgi:two-component system cell cycle response regulator CpdR
MVPPRVLLVEDEFLIRITLSEALADDGFVVVEAASGDEAVSLVREQPGFDLLLTDIQLPGRTDGHSVALAARERSPDLPVIFVSGRPRERSEPDSPNRELYITKPYLLSEICAAARRLTAR